MLSKSSYPGGPQCQQIINRAVVIQANCCCCCGQGILCEYAHSMGNSTGNFKEYWDCFERLPQTQVHAATLVSCMFCRCLSSGDSLPLTNASACVTAGFTAVHVKGCLTGSWSSSRDDGQRLR